MTGKPPPKSMTIHDLPVSERPRECSRRSVKNRSSLPSMITVVQGNLRLGVTQRGRHTEARTYRPGDTLELSAEDAISLGVEVRPFIS